MERGDIDFVQRLLKQAAADCQQAIGPSLGEQEDPVALADVALRVLGCLPLANDPRDAGEPQQLEAQKDQPSVAMLTLEGNDNSTSIAAGPKEPEAEGEPDGGADCLVVASEAEASVVDLCKQVDEAAQRVSALRQAVPARVAHALAQQLAALRPHLATFTNTTTTTTSAAAAASVVSEVAMSLTPGKLLPAGAGTSATAGGIPATPSQQAATAAAAATTTTATATAATLTMTPRAAVGVAPGATPTSAMVTTAAMLMTPTLRVGLTTPLALPGSCPYDAEVRAAHGELLANIDKLPRLKARLDQAVDRLTRVLAVVEAEQARPPPHTLERALRAQPLEPLPLALAGAQQKQKNRRHGNNIVNGIKEKPDGEMGDADMSTAGCSGAVSPILASPLPPHATSQQENAEGAEGAGGGGVGGGVSCVAATPGGGGSALRGGGGGGGAGHGRGRASQEAWVVGVLARDLLSRG